jgi:type 1 fimbria pilin
MNRATAFLALLIAAASPLVSRGATVASTAIPDGTYTFKVERIVDAKHVVVLMDNGNETTLPAGRPNIDFSKIQPNDQIKVSLVGGSVMVYLDITQH